MKIDLHIHTSASDSTWTPEVLVENIISSGIKIFAVTDHDTVDNISAVKRLAEKNNLQFIQGVEIYAAFEKMSYHVLGYGVDIQSAELNRIIKRNREASENANRNDLDYLVKKGYPVSLAEYDSYINNRERGGWKALNYLIDKGLCSTYKDYFKLFKDKGNPLDGISFSQLDEVISVIKNAGGFSVIAHPGAAIYSGDYKDTIGIMYKSGINGIECYHPENSPEVTEYTLTFCKKNNLFITGGSDCHGDFVKARRLGKPDIDSSMLNLGNLLKK